ncbi:MAG: MBL fold metallo-hydrolase [Acidobacteria bacterium]|nr:MBL fold metallo-hydrolase [Acidobacteriota bacterium]MBI3484358.1 MBL fold metallo-hydrolase [Acidobacteriota bacterium]
MRRKMLGVVVLLLSLGLFAPSGMAQSFDIVKVADGVYAAIGRAGVASNGAFIVNKDDVLVVDTHFRPSWAKDLIAEIRKITNKPVRYVVNTHWHNDHVQGNQAYVSVFGSGVEYIAQHTAREDMVSKAIPSVQDQLTKDVPGRIARTEKMLAEGKATDGTPLTDVGRTNLSGRLASDKAYLEELKSIQIALPTITFERSLVLYKPDRTIHILFFGKGHTRGDVVIYLPKERVVVTGDLLTNGIPFMRDAYPSQWIGTLDSVRNLDWDTAVTGHGGVQTGKEQVDRLLAYMKDMVAAVKDAIGKGMTLEDAKKSIDLSKHQAGFPAYQPPNPPGFAAASTQAVERTWAELTGKIPN